MNMHLINVFKQAQQTTTNITNALRSQTTKQPVSQLGQQEFESIERGLASELGDGVKV